MTRRLLSSLVVMLLIAAVGAPLLSQAQEPPTTPWWEHAVFYEIYPRSFQDTNGDGIGDFNGITSRLGYLEDLGIDAIWIAPCYPSPLVDFGYDVSNYEAVDPTYGSMADFDHMVTEAKRHHIHILMDMVVNHTSDQHAWFLESRSSRTNPKREWYIWRDGKRNSDGELGPPNNWHSVFGGSAWTFDPATGQYYYHRFYAQQPDLNWRNPAVVQAMFDQMRFWLDRGVGGFRLDAVDTLLEDPNLGDEAVRRDANGQIMRDRTGFPLTVGDKTSNLPEIHDIIRRMRAMVGSYPGHRVLIGETYLPNIGELEKWYGGSAKNELQIPMDTQLGVRSTLNPQLWRQHLIEAETDLHGSLPLFVFDNHDNNRLDRYCKVSNGAAPGADCRQIQKMLETILLTSRAVVLMYYGDEIGMSTGAVSADPKRRRDSERTPMQWDTDRNAGFSTAQTTWLPVLPEYKTVNVAVEQTQSDSLLQWHKALIALRRNNPVLRDGSEQDFTSGNPNIVAYVRTLASKKILVLTNFSGSPQKAAMAAYSGSKVHLLATNFDAKLTALGDTFMLPPYGAVVAELP